MLNEKKLPYMVITNNTKLAELISALRHHGEQPNEKYVHNYIAYNERLDTIQAAILNVKLKCLVGWTNRRIEIAGLYDKQLVGFNIPYKDNQAKHVYHQYVIRFKDRIAVRNKLQDKGICTCIHYPIPIHLLPAYVYLELGNGSFPITEKVSNEVLSIPIYPEMTEEEIKYVAESLHNL